MSSKISISSSKLLPMILLGLALIAGSFASPFPLSRRRILSSSLFPEWDNVPLAGCEKDGFFPSGTNCHAFTFCKKGIPYPLRCPTNWHFNPQTRLCDWRGTEECTPPTAPSLFPYEYSKISQDSDSKPDLYENNEDSEVGVGENDVTDADDGVKDVVKDTEVDPETDGNEGDFNGDGNNLGEGPVTEDSGYLGNDNEGEDLAKLTKEEKKEQEKLQTKTILEQKFPLAKAVVADAQDETVQEREGSGSGGGAAEPRVKDETVQEGEGSGGGAAAA